MSENRELKLTFIAFIEGASCSATEIVKEFDPTIVFPFEAERLIRACDPGLAVIGKTTEISIFVKAPISAVSVGDTVTFHSGFVQVEEIDKTVPTNVTKSCSTLFVPLRFRKAGRLWCGGARETH